MDKEGAAEDNVVEFWRSFDLDGRRTVLDQQCMEMREAKAQTSEARKRLNELTKEFRSSTSQDNKASVLELLKAYQDEIDRLGRRAKNSEAAFYVLYKQLAVAPDPVACLDKLQVLDAANASAQAEIAQLKREMDSYESEFSGLKNQDITIRQLEEQLQQYKDMSDAAVQGTVEARVDEIREKCRKEIMDSMHQQQLLERRLAVATEGLREAQASADRTQTQLFEMSRVNEEKLAASQSDRQILVEQIERQQLHCAELEREVQNWKRKATEIATVAPTPEPETSSAAEGILALQRALAEVRQELIQKDNDMKSQQKDLQAIITRQKEQLTLENARATDLRNELASRPSQEEITGLKRQLRILQQLVFNVDEDGAEDASPEDTPSSQNLEQMLLTKIRKLESEVITLRRADMERAETLDKAQMDLTSLQHQVREKAKLITQLEEQLSTAAVDPVSRDPSAELSRILGVDNASTPRPASVNLSADAATTGNDQSLLQILQSQRDRFKERLQTVERQFQEALNTITTLKSEKAELEQDNLSLYGKIRYLQGYAYRAQQHSPHDARRDAMARRSVSAVEEGRRDMGANVEGKYQQLYEQKMNPFAQFSQSERQRKLAELTVMDRFVLSTLKTVLMNRTGRTIVIVYFLAMHLLVFGTLYHWSHSQVCEPTASDMFHPEPATGDQFIGV